MSITLRDVIARRTPLEWFEAVAIVQAVSDEATCAQGEQAGLIPDLADIVLDELGAIRFSRPGRPGEGSPVFRAATLLSVLLPEDATPVQLKLLVLTSVSATPRYISLSELSRGLDYFERPDRQSVVRAVRDRAAALPAVEPTPDVAGGVSQATRPPAHEPASRRRTGITIAVLLLAAATSAAGLWWLSMRPPGATALTRTKVLVSEAIGSAAARIRSGLRAPAPVATPEPAPAPKKAASQGASGSGARGLLRPERSFVHNGLAPLTVDAPKPPSEAPLVPPQHVDEVIWLAPPPDDGTASLHAFSAADADVRPPVAVRPKLPSEPPAGVRVESLTRLEVLVSSAGEVDSVRIVSGPRDALDSMMLSAVKAWRFQPATKDGRPVAYRQLIWLTNTASR
jgi:periplasmic protein TonB